MATKKISKKNVKDFTRIANDLKQAGDPTRLQIIHLLRGGEKNVGEMCEVVKMERPAVSHHLALLRHGGIVNPKRVGKNVYYALTDSGANLSEAVLAVMNS